MQHANLQSQNWLSRHYIFTVLYCATVRATVCSSDALRGEGAATCTLATYIFKLANRVATAVLAPHSMNDGGLSVTVPRAQRHTRPVGEASTLDSTRNATKVCTQTDAGLHSGSSRCVTHDQKEKLVSQYPLFFRAVRHPEAYPSNLAHLGIQCGPGWYPIIEAAAQEIEHELRTMWFEPLQNPRSLSAMDEELLSGRKAYPVLPFCSDISQVEGALMMDIECGHLCDMAAWRRLRKSVEQAASKSRYTCESCGKPGRFREIHWRHVYCDACIAPFGFDLPTK